MCIHNNVQKIFLMHDILYKVTKEIREKYIKFRDQMNTFILGSVTYAIVPLVTALTNHVRIPNRI